jgi:FlgD Ig-like domain
MRVISLVRSFAVVSCVIAVPSFVAAQSLNVDFGDAGSTPSASYAAAGLAGTWNTVGVLPTGQRQGLVDLAGQPSAAKIYMNGGNSVTMLNVNDPGTSGNDQSLMDDMLICQCNPVDMCLWVEHLTNGEYEVTTYAMTPSEPTRFCPVRVDDGTPGPTNVGGAWPGAQQELVTFSRHTVTVSNGVVAFHSGTYNGFFQSGMNGFQLRLIPATGVDPLGTSSTRIRSITPNPAASIQRIDFSLASARDGALEILDLTGRVIWRRSFAGLAGGLHTFEWDGRDLAGHSSPPGIYFARLAGVGPGASLHKLVRIE